MSTDAQRELDAIDAALAGRPVAAEQDSLARFARELRAVRPHANERGRGLQRQWSPSNQPQRLWLQRWSSPRPNRCRTASA